MLTMQNWLRLSTRLLLIAAAAASPAAAHAASAQDFEARKLAAKPGAEAVPYRLFVPPNYDRAQRYPMIFYLHGAGERGTDNRSHLVQQPGPLAFLSAQNVAKQPAFMVAPQLSGKHVTWSDIHPQLFEILRTIEEEFSIDPDRIYLTGLSMGGAGTYDMLLKEPSRFAAAVVMSAWEDAAVDSIKQIPIWSFHGRLDDIVDVGYGRGVIEDLRRAGGNPIYTELMDGTHLIWTRAYQTPGLFDWLMSQRRGAPSAPRIRLEKSDGTSEATFATDAVEVQLRGSVSDSGPSIEHVWWSKGIESTEIPLSGTTFEATIPLDEGMNRVTFHVRDRSFTTFTAQVEVMRSVVSPPPEEPSVATTEASRPPEPSNGTPAAAPSAPQIGNMTNASSCSVAHEGTDGQGWLSTSILALLFLFGRTRKRD